MKQERDSAAVEDRRRHPHRRRRPDGQPHATDIGAVKTYATEEEISNAMRDVFGTYVEQAIV